MSGLMSLVWKAQFLGVEKNGPSLDFCIWTHRLFVYQTCLYKIRIRTSIRTFEAQIIKKMRTLSLGKKRSSHKKKKVYALREDSVYINAWSLFIPSLLIWVNVQPSEVVCEQTRTWSQQAVWVSMDRPTMQLDKMSIFLWICLTH